ncbi:histidine phosphatase family protein [Parasulfuritortus cantonensis]|uniref:Histidine phosphatase family protein n=1 Tax=Parasulfuritortus cantonensis TaxID=2528202 RepID=A0A4R1B6J5_9PROT|nr:histidine phosphatase family protein [Parasulfuritortus cantonensis]TCJ11898.1 histidine phosphatase family protein [Parasulfuritortus cantonensis]
MRVIFMRHGESEYNLRKLCNADPAVAVGLTEDGRAQSRRAAQRWRDLPFGRVYVSRLQRAQETAAIVCGGHCPAICVDARLDDRRTGYEGRPVETYLRAMGAAPDPFDWKAGDGESYREMVARVDDFLDDLAGAGAQSALVVTHHEVLQAVAGRFRRLDLDAMWRVWLGHCETLSFEL